MNADAFLAALRDDPADDVTRLVFADWLEDLGDDARARFIRLAVRLEQTPADDPAHASRLARYNDLRLTHLPTWLGPTPDSLEDVGLRGGVVTRLVFRHDAPGADIDAMLRRHPVSDLSICGERSVRELARSSCLGSIHSLTMRQGLRKRQARLLDRLLDSPRLARLRELTLVGETVDNYLASVLADSLVLRELRSLRLERTLLDDVGTRRLLEPGTLPRLESWHVECPQATSRGLTDLFAPSRLGVWRSLTWPSLRLSSPDDLVGLGDCTQLRRLQVCCTWGFDSHLLHGLTRLEELDIFGRVSTQVADAVAMWPGLYHLKRLRIGSDYLFTGTQRDSIRQAVRTSMHYNPRMALELAG